MKLEAKTRLGCLSKNFFVEAPGIIHSFYKITADMNKALKDQMQANNFYFHTFIFHTKSTSNIQINDRRLKTGIG
jgi:hypothetical protein